MFSKEINEEIKAKTREINKLKSVDERLSATIEFKDLIQGRINDELDELFSNINLKKKRDED
jgi:hypothetical protein